jgi:hypothetical protein
MKDVKGDKSKQPAGCTVNKNSRCPNLKEVTSSFDTERYECAVCGERYTLYYEDMK